MIVLPNVTTVLELGLNELFLNLMQINILYSAAKIFAHQCEAGEVMYWVNNTPRTLREQQIQH